MMVSDIKGFCGLNHGFDDLRVAVPQVEYPAITMAVDQGFTSGHISDIGTTAFPDHEFHAILLKGVGLAGRYMMTEIADDLFLICFIHDEPNPYTRSRLFMCSRYSFSLL